MSGNRPTQRRALSKDPQLSTRISPEHQNMLRRLIADLNTRRPTVREAIELLIENEYHRRYGND